MGPCVLLTLQPAETAATCANVAGSSAAMSPAITPVIDPLQKKATSVNPALSTVNGEAACQSPSAAHVTVHTPSPVKAAPTVAHSSPLQSNRRRLKEGERGGKNQQPSGVVKTRRRFLPRRRLVQVSPLTVASSVRPQFQPAAVMV